MSAVNTSVVARPMNIVSSIKYLLSRHQLAGFFALAYAGAWLAFLPPLLAQNGFGILPFKLPLAPFLVLASFSGPALAALLVAWSAGGTHEPPDLLPAAAPVRGAGPVGEVLAGVVAGEEVGVDELVTLLSARGPDLARVCEVADNLRRDAVGDVVTFVRNRNINYTNVCTFKCRFCAFSKGPLSLNLRGQPYLLELEEMQRRVVEAVDCGATEVCLQGGIHPDFDGDYYIDVARAESAKKRAEQRLATPAMTMDFERARIAMLKSLIRLQVASRARIRS